MDWLWNSWGAIGATILTAMVVYAALILYTRLAGLRSFSKMSSFDFATTVAIGSLLASVVINPGRSLVTGLVAMAAIFAIQGVVAAVRARSEATQAALDNEPLLIMEGEKILHENLKVAQMTLADLRAKLREANVVRLSEVRAVVFESTGDISVLHGEPGGAALDDWLMEGVRRG